MWLIRQAAARVRDGCELVSLSRLHVPGGGSSGSSAAACAGALIDPAATAADTAAASARADARRSGLNSDIGMFLLVVVNFMDGASVGVAGSPGQTPQG
jgi:hypothetical protein